MKKIFKNCSVLIGGSFKKIDFSIENGKFSEFGNFDNGTDLNGAYVIPGLFDIHTHGGAGVCFDNIKKQDFEKIFSYYISQGATSVLATTTTLSDEQIKCQLLVLAKLCETYPIFKGIHLEGPFLSKEYKGAMNENLLQEPNFEKLIEYQKLARGHIKLITIAPELMGVTDFIKRANEMGIVVSLGHSGASYAQANEALDCGAKSFTHTFNAMKPISHKGESSILVSALESDAYAEIIADGKHVNRDLFKLLLKCKGLDKIIGITDSLAEAGLPDGDYLQGDGRIIQKAGGDLFYANSQTRAGSAIGIFDCLVNFSEFTNKPIEKCARVFTENPANLLSVYYDKIEKNSAANFIVFKDKKLQKVYLAGNCVYGEK